MAESDDDDYLDNAKNEIIRWEGEKPGFLSKVGDAVLWPAQKAAEALIPEKIQDAVSKAVEKFFDGVEWTARQSISLNEIRERVGTEHETLLEQLKAADLAAKHYWNWHVAYGAVEGGATGALGLPGLAADIPALFTVCMRLIQQIATCYGYNISDENERDYILQILQAGSTSDVKAKTEFVIALKQVEQILLKVSWKKMNEALARKEMSRLSAIAAMKKFAERLGIQVTKRKALQMVPIVGGVVGASFNATFVNDVGRAAYMSYRRRWLAERSPENDDTVYEK
jgi:hypothetical protein